MSLLLWITYFGFIDVKRTVIWVSIQQIMVLACGNIWILIRSGRFFPFFGWSSSSGGEALGYLSIVHTRSSSFDRSLRFLWWIFSLWKKWQNSSSTGQIYQFFLCSGIEFSPFPSWLVNFWALFPFRRKWDYCHSTDIRIFNGKN